MKELSAAAVVRRLKVGTPSQKVTRPEVKYLNYRGYEIHVHPPYFKENPEPCFIGVDNVYEAMRHGIPESKMYVDQQIQMQKDRKAREKRLSRKKIMCKVKKVKK